MPFYSKILGLLISSIYVNFPEFISIIRSILLQMSRGNREKVQAFSVSMNSRIAGSGFGLEVGRIDLYWQYGKNPILVFLSSFTGFDLLFDRTHGLATDNLQIIMCLHIEPVFRGEPEVTRKT
jgi:hypothetical protein